MFVEAPLTQSLTKPPVGKWADGLPQTLATDDLSKMYPKGYMHICNCVDEIQDWGG